MIEDFKAVLLSLLLFTVGFVVGNEYTSQKQVIKTQSEQIGFLMQQLPILKNLNGS